MKAALRPRRLSPTENSQATSSASVRSTFFMANCDPICERPHARILSAFAARIFFQSSLAPALIETISIIFLRHPTVVDFVTSRCEGVNLPRLSPKQLAVLPIPIPFADDRRRSLAEQKRIAAILDKADAIRRKRREQIGFANHLTTSLFQEMFGEWLRMPSSKMPRLGEPEIADIASGVTKGRRFNGQPTVIVPYIRVANVQDGFLNLAEIKTIEALPSDVESLRLQHGDVLMTEGGDFDKLGRGAMWEADIPDCIHQNHVFRVRCNRRNLLPIYFANYIRTEIARAYFLRCAKKTSNLASMNMTQLKATPVACPPINVQQQFVNAGPQMIARTRARHTAAFDDSEQLFHSLVKRAFTGQL